MICSGISRGELHGDFPRMLCETEGMDHVSVDELFESPFDHIFAEPFSQGGFQILKDDGTPGHSCHIHHVHFHG